MILASHALRLYIAILLFTKFLSILPNFQQTTFHNQKPLTVIKYQTPSQLKSTSSLVNTDMSDSTSHLLGNDAQQSDSLRTSESESETISHQPSAQLLIDLFGPNLPRSTVEQLLVALQISA
jgi:hypothetical protein